MIYAAIVESRTVTCRFGNSFHRFFVNVQWNRIRFHKIKFVETADNSRDMIFWERKKEAIPVKYQ